MKWVTRERPKIDRIACPWLVTRFIDKEPEFLFVAPRPGAAHGAQHRRYCLRRAGCGVDTCG